MLKLAIVPFVVTNVPVVTIAIAEELVEFDGKYSDCRLFALVAIELGGTTLEARLYEV